MVHIRYANNMNDNNRELICWRNECKNKQKISKERKLQL